MGSRLSGIDLWSGRSRSIEAEDAFESVDRDSPIVLSVPHSGTWVPSTALGFLVSTRELLVDTDIATDTLYTTALPDASHVITRVSPYVVNVNRAPRGRAAPVLPPRHLYGALTHLRAPTTSEERTLRTQFYLPYHQAVRRLLTAAVRRHGYALLLDGHSMNSSGGPLTKDPGEARATFIVGDCNQDSAAPAVGGAFAAALARAAASQLMHSQGWTVARNKPYAGGWVVRANGKPRRGIHALQLETSKASYLNGEAYSRTQATHARLSPDPKRLKLVAAAIAGAAQAAAEVASRLGRRSVRSASI